jgi:hypothetical protein
MMVVFQGYVPFERHSWVYVRTHGRVGMQVEEDVVTVPGYLLEGKGMVAQPGVDGGIEAVIPANANLRSRVISLSPGTWQVTVDPPNPNVEVGLYGGKQRPTKVLSVTGEPREFRLRVTSGDISSLLGKIRIERVSDDSLASPAPALLEQPAYPIEPFGTFQKGLGSWRKRGRAFNKNPSGKTRKGQMPIRGNVGKFLNSFGPKTGSKVEGHLTSEPFTVIAGTVLSFRIAGGKDKRVGVRLIEGDRTMMAWHGQNTSKLEEVRFALTPYAGRTVHIEVFDELKGLWGHVLADEFVILHPVTGESDDD